LQRARRKAGPRHEAEAEAAEKAPAKKAPVRAKAKAPAKKAPTGAKAPPPAAKGDAKKTTAARGRSRRRR
jgi:hypothetical protein